MTPPPKVSIHYRRLPDRLQVYVQELVLDRPEVKVTFQPSTPLSAPVQVEGTTILEPGAPAVWFTFPGRWHDIGRFHTADGRFTGIYANVLTPPVLDAGGANDLRWDTTDLFLDVWLPEGGPPRILDRDQLDDALARGWLDDATARRALDEAEAIVAAHGRGEWPPEVVHTWTLARARSAS